MACHKSKKRKTEDGISLSKSSDDAQTHDDNEEFVCMLDARSAQYEHKMYRVPISVLPLGLQRKLKEEDKPFLNCSPYLNMFYNLDEEEGVDGGDKMYQIEQITDFFETKLEHYRVQDGTKGLKPFRYFMSFSAMGFDDHVKIKGNAVLNYDQEKLVRITNTTERGDPQVSIVPIAKLPENMRKQLESSDRKYYLNITPDNWQDLDAREFNDDEEDENYNAEDIREEVAGFLRRIPSRFDVEPLYEPLRHCQWEIMFSDH